MTSQPKVTLTQTPCQFVSHPTKKVGRPRKNSAPPAKQPKTTEENCKESFLAPTDPASSAVIELQEWDPREVPPGFFMVLEGKRRTGKSTFARWFMQWHQDDFSLVWVMSQTAVNGYWQSFVGKDWVFDRWREDAVVRLIERNKKIVEKYGEDSPIAKEIGSALIIFDDCITRQIFDSDVFVRLAVEGRHHLISIIYITQDPKTVCPKVRDNCDVAVVFNQKTMRNKESIWHDFMNDVDKNTAFALLSRYAVEHDALMCIQTNLNGDLRRNFMKSTGDKTKLQDPDYVLGGPKQKEAILKEKKEAAEAAKMERLKEKADHRPNKDKIPGELQATNFTTEKVEGGGVSIFSLLNK